MTKRNDSDGWNPTIPVSGNLLIGYAAALRDLLREVEYLKCDVEACGCASSRRIAFARKQLAAMEALIGDAVTTEAE